MLKLTNLFCLETSSARTLSIFGPSFLWWHQGFYRDHSDWVCKPSGIQEDGTKAANTKVHSCRLLSWAIVVGIWDHLVGARKKIVICDQVWFTHLPFIAFVKKNLHRDRTQLCMLPGTSFNRYSEYIINKQPVVNKQTGLICSFYLTTVVGFDSNIAETQICTFRGSNKSPGGWNVIFWLQSIFNILLQLILSEVKSVETIFFLLREQDSRLGTDISRRRTSWGRPYSSQWVHSTARCGLEKASAIWWRITITLATWRIQHAVDFSCVLETSTCKPGSGQCHKLKYDTCCDGKESTMGIFLSK